MRYDLTNQILTFVEPVAMITLLVFLYGLINRSIPQFADSVDRSGVIFNIVVGMIFGLCVIYTMIDPIRLSSGPVFDMRCLFVGAATGLFGPVAGLVPLAMGGALRASIGGVGVGPGIASIFMSFVGAWMWRSYIREKFVTGTARGITLGLAISIHIPAILMLPREIWIGSISMLAPYYLISNTLGALIIMALVRREDRLMIETYDLELAAHRDPLTGLLNRRKMEALHTAYANAADKNGGVAIIYFDLDGFKSINDRYGHTVGDNVLKLVASKLEAEVRSHDFVGRTGGDEFVVMLPRVEPEVAYRIAERCRKSVSAGIVSTDTGNFPITISIGCSWQKRPTTFENDLKAADRELYRAKASGRNFVSFANVEHETRHKSLEPSLIFAD